MSFNFAVLFCSIIYIILIFGFYFTKKRINNIETKIYSILLINVMFSIFFEFFCLLTAKFNLHITMESLTSVIGRIFLVVITTWIFIFTAYVYFVTSSREKDTKYKKTKLIYFSLYFISVILVCTLPLYYYKGVDVAYTYGISTDFLVLLLMLSATFGISRCLINRKKLNLKKIIPIFAFILGIIVLGVVRTVRPDIQLVSTIFTFITILMYFTIENPDMKLINQLELAKDSAEKANHAKTDFLSSMSHEIRTPLNAIVGFSQCIENATNLEEAKEDARDIVMASQNLLEIVNGILDISKIEADKMEIVNTEYNLKEILNNLTKLIKARIGEKDIELKTNFATDLPDILYGDSGKVKQVITNVLTNAAKYTDHGEIEFNVNCVNNKDQCRLIISIRDTGRGIKTEQIDKLFNKFQRLDEDKNTTVEGTGLGLAITKRLVEMMGGKIVVQSEYGEGSIFTIYLTQDIRNGLYKKEEVVEEVVSFDNKKVLLVDDNKLNIKVGTKILKEYNL